MSRPITADAMEHGTRGWTATQRADVDRAVRKAGRHSVLVRVVRIGLPAVVAVSLTGFVLFTYFKPMQILEKLPNVSGKLAVQGSKITMELPRVAGFTRDQRAYELHAETAVQDILTPDVVELQNPRAKMELQDQDVVVMTANTGTYDTKADKIVLRDRIIITSQQGYRANLREAVVEMKKGTVISDQPIEITMPTGKLKANRLEILDSGDLVRFDNGVVLDLDGEKKQEASR